MKSSPLLTAPCLYCCIALMLMATIPASGQTVAQEKMQQLRFMVGDWVGISKTYKKDTVSTQIPAFESINYKIDQNIITIDLYSESLQLHTVIYYDEERGEYLYNPFYKNGAGKYSATYQDGQFIVQPNKKKRFIFHLTPEGDFQEYGEELKDGKWVKYFEDTFKRMP